jgi:hypothetical protein
VLGFGRAAHCRGRPVGWGWGLGELRNVSASRDVADGFSVHNDSLAPARLAPAGQPSAVSPEAPSASGGPPVVLSVLGLPLQGGRHNMTDTSGEAEPLGAKTLALHSISAIAFPCL